MVLATARASIVLAAAGCGGGRNAAAPAEVGAGGARAGARGFRFVRCDREPAVLRGRSGAGPPPILDFFLEAVRRRCLRCAGKEEEEEAEEVVDEEEVLEREAEVESAVGTGGDEASGRSKLVFHTITISSLEPDAKYSPVAENPTALAAPVCPCSVYNK